MNKLSCTFAPIAHHGSRVIPKWSKQLQKRKLIVKTLGGEKFLNSCCVLPVEKIACNEHLTNGECCLITDASEVPAAAPCPVSQTVGRKIERRALESLLKPYARGLLELVQYYYCPDPHCPIVYFSNVDVRTFSFGELLVPVFEKDKGEHVPVCYCFEWTRKRIKDQIAEAGKSTAAIEIAQKVKARECTCDVKNPKARCCLGDVNAFVKEVQKATV